MLKISSAAQRTGRAIFHLVAAGALLFLAHGAHAAPLPSGAAKVTLDVDDTPIEVYTYKPERYAGGALLLTLHGVGRNAAGYRDYAKTLAERYGFLVAAPLFDRSRFPPWRYQAGGVVRTFDRRDRDSLTLEPEERWTGRLFLKIIDGLRAIEMTPELPYYMLGHSGGGQALSRAIAFVPNAARGIVIANPGSYLWPAREARFPDGFGGLPEPWSGNDAIRRYLAQPVTLLLGTADVHQDKDLTMREGAAAQGANRYERGLNTYRTAHAVAKAHGWLCNWKLIEVPGVGHSASRMLRSEQAAMAFAQDLR